MRILFYKANLLMQDDWMDTLQEAGHIVDPVTYIFTDVDQDEFFAKKFRKRLAKISYDAVVSFNYYPVISDLCNEFNIRYISWIYDSPIPFPRHMENPNNTLWHFDKADVTEYQKAGYKNIKYLPLAVNIRRLDNQLSPLDNMPAYQHDISFVGNLYTDRSIKVKNFVSSEYVQGLLEGYAAIQTQFYGCDIAKELMQVSPYIKAIPFPDNFPWDGFYRSVQDEATYQERTKLIHHLALYYDVDLYTSETIPSVNKLHVHPAIGYYTTMPAVFRHSKINLNINYRAIRTGMSARLLDIMGSGGFLLTTPQPELFDFFEPGIDFVPFYSLDDLTDKCEYYLNHPEERHQIAKNGYQKVKQFHAYEARFSTLLSL